MYNRRHIGEHLHNHNKQNSREREFDAAEDQSDDNPLYDDKAMVDFISVTLSKAAALELQFAQLARGWDNNDDVGGSDIILEVVGPLAQKQYSELRPGLFLRQVGENSTDGLELATIKSWLAQANDHDELSLAFLQQQPTLGGEVIGATNAIDRISNLESSLSLSHLVSKAW